MKITPFRILVTLTIALVICLLVWQQYRLNKAYKQGQLDRIKLSMYEDSVSVLKDRNDHLTFKIQAVEVSSSNTREALKAAGYEIKDLRAREIKWRDLSVALQMKLDQSGQGTITLHDTTYITNTDTVSSKIGKWSDHYLSLFPIITGNKMDFKYDYRTGIDVFVTRNGRESIVNVFLTDPTDRTKTNEFGRITTGSSFVITPERHWYTNKWLYLGAGIVGGYFLFK